MNYDPLGDREWAAGQAENRFQASVREYEDLTGRQHPLREDGKVERDEKPVNSSKGWYPSPNAFWDTGTFDPRKIKKYKTALGIVFQPKDVGACERGVEATGRSPHTGPVNDGDPIAGGTVTERGGE